MLGYQKKGGSLLPALNSTAALADAAQRWSV
jgi:hypothetical protein